MAGFEDARATHPAAAHLQRVNVVGSSGSGKSTFARRLAARLGSPYLEMDALYWLPNWAEPSDAEFFPRLAAAVSGEHWVLDGNYTRTTAIKWARVQSVIWLDFSYLCTLFRIVKRTAARVRSAEELWPGTGNRETLAKALSPSSVVWWMMRSHPRLRRSLPQQARLPVHAAIRFVRLRSPQAAERFLASIEPPVAADVDEGQRIKS